MPLPSCSEPVATYFYEFNMLLQRIIYCVSKLSLCYRARACYYFFKHCLIVIIFGRYIPEGCWLKTVLSILTSSSYFCFYTTWEIKMENMTFVFLFQKFISQHKIFLIFLIYLHYYI